MHVSAAGVGGPPSPEGELLRDPRPCDTWQLPLAL